MNRNGLYYNYIIKRMIFLEKIEYELKLLFIKVVNRYQNKYNKSIFK